MLKPFSSSPSSITRWAYKKSGLNSLPGWEELISTMENADLLLTLASDQNCPQRASVLKCLYSLVGSSVSTHTEVDVAKINVLLEKAMASPDQIILNWVNRSKVVLGDLRKFDYVEWCQGGFSKKDLPTAS